MSQKKLFLASGNAHKIEELRQILQPLNIRLSSVLEWEDPVEVDEDQTTLQGNALKKARYWAGETGLPVIADDTGLEVDALNGAPGVYSARYAGENVTYEDNVRKLLSELTESDNRAARFRTVIAFINDGKESLFEGICEGEITRERSGSGGFGYDPVFRPVGFNRTFAELAADQKNRISHRGLALQKLIRHLSEGD